MKKKMPIMLLAGLALTAIAGRASAVPIPFQIGGSTLEVSADGIGEYTYTDNSMGSPVSLEEGSSHYFNFGHVYIPFAIAEGTAKLTVQLLSPTSDGTVEQLGGFEIFGLIFGGWLSLDWNGASLVNYSWDGYTGGLLSLRLDDYSWFYGRGGFDITGRIKNEQSPTVETPTVQVQEPGVLLLLGSALLGFAVFGRRKTLQV